jgi:hypothetical protein
MITAIESRKGDANLQARRFEIKDGDTDFDLARLAVSRQDEKSPDGAAWRGLRRISVMFSDPASRAKFGGTPNVCHCKVKKTGDLNSCLREGHRGMYGEVQEYWRKQAHESYEIRFGSQRQVVRGQMRGR